jgi:hypothetical protein
MQVYHFVRTAQSRIFTISEGLSADPDGTLAERVTAMGKHSPQGEGLPVQEIVDLFPVYFERNQRYSEGADWRRDSLFESRAMGPEEAMTLFDDPFNPAERHLHICELGDGGIIILSLGPNQQIDSKIDPLTPIMIPYDPTNGMAESTGDIYVRIPRGSPVAEMP